MGITTIYIMYWTVYFSLCLCWKTISLRRYHLPISQCFDLWAVMKAGGLAYQVRVITVFTVLRLLTDFVCLHVYTYEFWLSVWKIVRSSVILLLPLFSRYIYFWNLQFLNNVIIIRSKTLLPQPCVTLANVGHPV